MVLGNSLSPVGTCCEMSHCSHNSIAVSVRRHVIRKLDKHQTPQQQQQQQPLLALKAGTEQHQKICAEDLPVYGDLWQLVSNRSESHKLIQFTQPSVAMNKITTYPPIKLNLLYDYTGSNGTWEMQKAPCKKSSSCLTRLVQVTEQLGQVWAVRKGTSSIFKSHLMILKMLIRTNRQTCPWFMNLALNPLQLMRCSPWKDELRSAGHAVPK